MEITKYLCEFFFTDFLHWLGLWFIIGTIFHGELIKIGKFNNKEEK
jgi:D-alanyl-lipoteichoic acid acyltransferase DltB (MBOAT superfamily)